MNWELPDVQAGFRKGRGTRDQTASKPTKGRGEGPNRAPSSRNQLYQIWSWTPASRTNVKLISVVQFSQFAVFITAKLFKIPKDDAVKVLHTIWQQICKTQQWSQDWESLVFIPIPKKGNAKECSNYCTIALISHASKVILKSSKLAFSSTLTENFQMHKLD